MRRLLTCASVFLLGTAWIGFADDVVRFADAPYPPYVVGEIDAVAEGGIAVELMRAIFAEMDVELTISLYPFPRALKMVEFGRADGICLLMADRGRESFLAYTDPLFESRELLFYNADQRSAPPRFDAAIGRLGLVHGFSYGAGVEELIHQGGVIVEYSATSEESFRKLLAGRVDYVVEDEAVAEAIMANNGWQERIGWLHEPLTIYPFHAAVSRRAGYADLLSRMNAALEELRRSGRLSELVPSLPSDHR